jgi:hypothetical protein
VLAVCSANGSLSALHIRAVAHHQNTHERVAVGVPSNNGLVFLLLVATADTFILERHASTLFLGLRLGFDGMIDVSDLIVAHRHQVDTSYL